jgi:hypothetical protein
MGNGLETCHNLEDSVRNSKLKKSSIVWDIKPCSPVKVNRNLEDHVASYFRVEE